MIWRKKRHERKLIKTYKKTDGRMELWDYGTHCETEYIKDVTMLNAEEEKALRRMKTIEFMR